MISKEKHHPISTHQIEIVPAILVKSMDELRQRIRDVEPFVTRFHLDVMDGLFVPNRTVQPEDMTEFRTSLKGEAHLMVNDNDRYADRFLELNFDTIIVHYESCKNISEIIEKIRHHNKNAGLAINPQTPVSAIKEYLDMLNVMLIMTVNPGFSGQSFESNAVSKIKEIRDLNKNLAIEVDGGIKVGTARIAAKAGADALISCSAIYDSDDKQKAIEALRVDALSTITG